MERNSSDKFSMGEVKIHENVIISIASIASYEIDGVERIGKKPGFNLLNFLGFENSKGITVEINKAGDLKSIQIPLIVKYGYNISEIAERVQENVRHEIEKITDKTPRNITINIQEIEK